MGGISSTPMDFSGGLMDLFEGSTFFGYIASVFDNTRWFRWLRVESCRGRQGGQEIECWMRRVGVVANLRFVTGKMTVLNRGCSGSLGMETENRGQHDHHGE